MAANAQSTAQANKRVVLSTVTAIAKGTRTARCLKLPERHTDQWAPRESLVALPSPLLFVHGVESVRPSCNSCGDVFSWDDFEKSVRSAGGLDQWMAICPACAFADRRFAEEVGFQ